MLCSKSRWCSSDPYFGDHLDRDGDGAACE
ncbi:excalibur calcium-binding domain-containing protein [Domibacillus sp. 8LH]